MSCVLRIGLTGGIGSGKSEASRQFFRLGAAVIDTDIIARELVEPGRPALAEIVAAFGTEILAENGGLDRDRLRQRVFSAPERRRKLEQILHPRILERAVELTNRAESPYCVLVIPLLAEAGRDYPVDRILVIDTPREQQIARVAARNNMPRAELEAILAAQASREERLQIADDVLVNDGTLEQFHGAIARLHRSYLQLAAGERRDPDTTPAD